MGIFTKNFSCLSFIGAEKIKFPPLCLRQTDRLTDGQTDGQTDGHFELYSSLATNKN